MGQVELYVRQLRITVLKSQRHLTGLWIQSLVLNTRKLVLLSQIGGASFVNSASAQTWRNFTWETWALLFPVWQPAIVNMTLHWICILYDHFRCSKSTLSPVQRPQPPANGVQVSIFLTASCLNQVHPIDTMDQLSIDQHETVHCPVQHNFIEQQFVNGLIDWTHPDKDLHTIFHLQYFFQTKAYLPS